MRRRAPGRIGSYTSLPMFLSMRPATRADCLGHEGPCPWASCRFSLLADVLPGRVIERPAGEHTCALDVADEGPHSLAEVGRIAGGVARQSVHETAVAATDKLARAAGRAAGRGAA